MIRLQLARIPRPLALPPTESRDPRRAHDMESGRPTILKCPQSTSYSAPGMVCSAAQVLILICASFCGSLRWAQWHTPTTVAAVPTSQVSLRSLRYATQTFTWTSILISTCDMGLSLCVVDGCNRNLETARYQTRMPEMAVLLGRAHVTTTTCAWRVFSRAYGMVKQARTHRVH